MVRVFLYGDVAQLAEQLLHTEKVGGSVPSITTNLWVFSSVNRALGYEPSGRGFESLKTLHIYSDSSTAEQTIDNR